MAAGECILYPCYFNAAYSRALGRRISRNLAVKAPALTDLERALKKAGIPFRVEEHSHPAHWARHEGRVVAVWKEKKEALIRQVAQRMGGRK